MCYLQLNSSRAKFISVLLASATQRLLAPLTSLWYQLLKNTQLGAHQENTHASLVQKIPRKHWGKLGGSRRTTKGLDHLPTKQPAERKDQAEHQGASALLPDRRVCGKPAQLQEGHTRQRGCQGRVGWAAPFLARATDGLSPWEVASPSL